MKHRLDPLLRPTSVAIVGASSSGDTMGHWALRNLLKGGYPGRIYPVNPRYGELQGVRCFASIAALPEVPDMVMFTVGDHRIESVLDEAIAAGIPAGVLMSSLVLDDDNAPPLKERVRRKVQDAGMLVCGANGMGYYNIRDHVWACGFDSRTHEAPGNVSFISHSGSGMCGIVDCEERIRFNFACSAGNELAVTMDQYLDFVLDLPETRVVGLFVETARNPQGFRAALQKAVERRIPIVALKVGRTERAAQLTVSHSGAMAGDDATYDALFDRYGVQRVRDMDELATALILFAELHPVGPGGLVSLHDSGGERQLMVDLCDETGVPLTELQQHTVAALEQVLDPELPAVNPLDAWSRGGPDAGKQMIQALTLMMQDPGAAMGAVVHDRAPHGLVYESYIAYMRLAHEASGKPAALVAARQGTGCDARVVSSTHAGLPVLDGLPAFLRGVRALFDYRDFTAVKMTMPATAPAWAVAKWQDRLTGGTTLDEVFSLQLLQDFGLPASPCEIAGNEADVVAAARKIGYPLALKTAMPGMLHKTEHKGVYLGIAGEAELLQKYHELLRRVGSRVLVAPMAEPGVEMILGARRDEQFGPVVVLGFGGILAELTRDVAFALPPFDAAYARRRIDRLKLRPLLNGARGKPAADIDAYCRMASDFSVVVDAMRDAVQEIDINPVIVGSNSCVAVDALIVGRTDISGEST
ncbi:MAG TPA: acetate--CoA ligase family protein [Woeseiaceae bacterium]|nr:acetate--CoA ligase family protein [Woeseiaceae bacterium]